MSGTGDRKDVTKCFSASVSPASELLSVEKVFDDDEAVTMEDSSDFLDFVWFTDFESTDAVMFV
jgi:hypothetical protein